MLDNKTDRSAQVVCPECEGRYAPGDFTTQDVEGQPGLKNIGLGCPHCGHFMHCFIEDARMRRYRATLMQRRIDWARRNTPGNWRAVERAKEKFGRVFDETQAQWRPALGLPAPGQMGEKERVLT